MHHPHPPHRRSRRVPSPTAILSIERRDSDDAAAPFSARRSAKSHTRRGGPPPPPVTTSAITTSALQSSNGDAEAGAERLYFFDESWVVSPGASPAPRVPPSAPPHTRAAQVHVAATARRSSTAAHDSKQAHHRREAYVSEEVLPRVAQLEHALAQRGDECAQLRQHNSVLARQVLLLQQRQQQQQDTAPTAAAPASAPTPATAVRSADSTGSNQDEDARVREATAEAALLQRERRRQSHPEPPPPLHREPASPPRTGSGATQVPDALAELATLCRAIADDGIGFTVAHHDALEHHAVGDTTRSPRAAVDAWHRFAAARAPPPTHGMAATSVFLLDSLRLLLAALQCEHAAVAAGMEALQQRTRRAETSAMNHQRLVEDVRRDAERRVAEMEADHDAEVQTLEDAIAELEQQVRLTTASRRPWTAGLLMRSTAEPSPVVARSSHRDSRVELAESADGAAASAGSSRAPLTADRSDVATQTELSIEWVQAAMRRARDEPGRLLRREREAELTELMVSEVERLRAGLTEARAVSARLREQQHRFLGDVTAPLDHLDFVSAGSLSGFA
ncbi:hypothetical protein NESM_000205300 [Novymonas esmeraldas]|uniref:Uncharacterized protein n=1 Tax=Novymonas esmeraldas TaxID=1808958 RepID=A0AAW0F714_9TRYP